MRDDRPGQRGNFHHEGQEVLLEESNRTAVCMYLRPHTFPRLAWHGIIPTKRRKSMHKLSYVSQRIYSPHTLYKHKARTPPPPPQDVLNPVSTHKTKLERRKTRWHNGDASNKLTLLRRPESRLPRPPRPPPRPRRRPARQYPRTTSHPPGARPHPPRTPRASRSPAACRSAEGLLPCCLGATGRSKTDAGGSAGRRGWGGAGWGIIEGV